LKRVSFDFESDSERALHAAYAKAKGLTVGQLARFALKQYEAKNPLKPSKLALAVAQYVKTMEDAALPRASTGYGYSGVARAYETLPKGGLSDER